LLQAASLRRSQLNEDENASLSTQLKVFEIFNNMIDSAGGKAVARLLSVSPSLTRLRMATTRVKEDGGKSIAQILSDPKYMNSSPLEYLCLSDNTLGPSTAILLAQGLQSLKYPNLKVLDLSDCGFDRGDSNESSSKILQVLADPSICPNLEEINFSESRLTIEVAPIFKSIIQNRPNLVRLILEGNELRDKGIKILLQGFDSSNSGLKHLVLARNELTSKCIALIKQALKSSKLESLNLNENYIKEENLEDIRSSGLLKSFSSEDNDPDMADEEDDDYNEEDEVDEDSHEKFDSEVDNLASDVSNVKI
jgi:Ran GTPase-activating protein (RanGAP) involved in mRNA processing and transport